MAVDHWHKLYRVAIVTLSLAVGCGKAPPPVPPSSTQSSAESSAVKPGAELTANEVLKKLLETYRKAKSYQDQGVVRLAFRQGGEPISQEWPAAVAFERPNRLSLVAYQATVKCDGKELKARIDDPDSNNVDGQMVVRPAPRDLQPADLAADRLLYDIISSQLRRQPIQLELLMDAGGLVSAFGTDVACKALEDRQYEGRKCFRIEVPSPGGPFVFWVDQSDFLLRRLDYPAAALVPDLANDPSVSELSLLADLREAAIGESVPAERFALDVPPAAKRMKTFVVPPRPLPSRLFGIQPGEFHFTELIGRRLESKDLLAKIVVLVWYHDNPSCAATLNQVALARQRLIASPDVSFFAVATDPTSRTNEQLQQRLVDWQAELPVVRDLEAFGDKSFHIEVQPTIIVLDKQGRVQIFQAGGNPQLAEQLVTIAERLQKGDDLAAEILARHEREQGEYQQLLAQGGAEPGQVIEVPEAVIHRQSEPKHLKLAPLWTCSELKSPGNILLVETAHQSPRVFVVEGWRTIAEIDAGGKVMKRYPLDLPEQSAVTFARTTTDKSGKRYFVASAPLAPQLFLFDEQWKLLMTYPPAAEQPLQVCDLAFADLGVADGTPEILAASVGDLGLIALSLAGEVRWRNRAFPNAVSLAVTPPDDIGSWGILVTGESGGVLRVNRFGKDEPPVTVGNWPILRLLGARFAGAKQAAMVGLSNNTKGELFAVGLTEQIKECWNYPLPAGVHQRPIEAVTSSHILPGRQGEWWLAGPDGSIHMITEDGELFDSFHYGAVLTGIAAAKVGENPVLIAATEGGLAAWTITNSGEVVSDFAKQPRER